MSAMAQELTAYHVQCMIHRSFNVGQNQSRTMDSLSVSIPCLYITTAEHKVGSIVSTVLDTREFDSWPKSLLDLGQ